MNLKKQFKAAFTIIELLVVLAIFAVIMSVALWNQKDLSNNILITNLAYEIALAVRETQAYGIGVRAIDSASPTSQNFQKSFGLYVSMSNQTQWTLFQDLNSNNKYDEGAGEAYTTYKFKNQNGNKIVAICAQSTGSRTREVCNELSATSQDELNIIFRRPNPEASFYARKGGDPNPFLGKGGPAYIVVNTITNNNCRAIVVETTGQIHVESATSPTPACSNL